MKNREKYAEQILDIACSGGSIAMSKETGGLLDCSECACLSCVFYDPEADKCAQNVKEWANSECAEKQKKWIPITERLPEDESYVLVSFQNATMVDIARYEEDDEGGSFYPGDDEDPYSKYGIYVNAWMPLPEPYREVTDEDNLESRR